MTRRILYKIPDTGKTLFIDLELNGVSIGFEGCGTYDDTGYAPVFLEWSAGQPAPKLHIWSDINQHDSTHDLSLEYACEARRAKGEP